jgi:uncharacterized protein
MEHKDLKLDVKGFSSDERTLEGYASTFGFPADSYGDIVARGAFIESIEKIKKEGLPLLMDHNTSINAVLGTIVEAYEDDKGLYIKAKLADTPRVNEVRDMLQQGHLNKMSIGFFIEKQSFTEDNGREIRVIEKANLMEVSVVTIPANTRAEILAVKEVELETPVEELKQETATTTEEVVEEIQTNDVGTEEEAVTENADVCETPKGISDEERASLENTAALLQQSLNNTRRKYDGK